MTEWEKYFSHLKPQNHFTASLGGMLDCVLIHICTHQRTMFNYMNMNKRLYSQKQQTCFNPNIT